MTITDKTRKLLWGKSGNQCAFCRQSLVVERTASDSESVVGDECHIVSLSGPRADPNFSLDKLDAYENLILLCKLHHKMVDDQSIEYSTDVLKRLKLKHEQRVSSLLKTSPAHRPKGPAVLPRLQTGEAVFAITVGACQFVYDHDPVTSDDEVELVGNFLQNVGDWGDLVGEIGAGERLRAAYAMTKRIDELEAAGWRVFGARDPRVIRIKGEFVAWPVAVIRVLRANSPQIQPVPTPAAGA